MKSRVRILPLTSPSSRGTHPNISAKLRMTQSDSFLVKFDASASNPWWRVRRRSNALPLIRIRVHGSYLENLASQPTIATHELAVGQKTIRQSTVENDDFACIGIAQCADEDSSPAYRSLIGVFIDGSSLTGAGSLMPSGTNQGYLSIGRLQQQQVRQSKHFWGFDAWIFVCKTRIIEDFKDDSMDPERIESPTAASHSERNTRCSIRSGSPLSVPQSLACSMYHRCSWHSRNGLIPTHRCG